MPLRQLIFLSLVSAVISAGLLNLPQFVIYGFTHWKLILIGSFGYGTPILLVSSLIIYSLWEDKVRKFSAGMLFSTTLAAMIIANAYLYLIYLFGGVDVHHTVASEVFPDELQLYWAHVQISIIGLSFPAMYLSMAALLLRFFWKPRS